MNIFPYILRFTYRIRFWLMIVPVVVAILVFILSNHLSQYYEVETSIYTGVISGQDVIAEDAGEKTANIQNAVMDNIMNIVTSPATLKRVSIRLYAQNMIHGESDRDNNYIRAAAYNELVKITPPEVEALIDKSSEEKTIENLVNYEKKSTNNFLYGLFYWNHPHYSYEALSKIDVKRVGTSDILKISYAADDPGIAYNTLKILNDEFANQYADLRFGEADDVIRFFEEELARVSTQLKESEDSLTNYNVQKKVINYDEQTKQIAAMTRDFNLQYEENLRNYYGSKAIVKTLEDRIGNNTKLLKNNSEFINKLNNISGLTSKIARIEALDPDSAAAAKRSSEIYKKQLKNAESDFLDFSQSFYQQEYSKEGYPNEEVVEQWLNELLRLAESTAEKQVFEEWRKSLDDDYSYYSPIGSTLKRKEREIDFTEASYLAILHSLNTARLRQKSMRMSTGTLRVLNPPSYPLVAMPTKRKVIVLAAFLASIIFVFGYFLILDLLDQTLKDKIRTKRITGGDVLGAFPRPSSLKNRNFDEECKQIASKYLSNTIQNYFPPETPIIINLLSSESQEGKSLICKYLTENWQKQGLNVKHLNWTTDFSPESREFVLAKSLKDIYTYQNEDILIVEHAPLVENSISEALLQEAALNLFIVKANRVWKETDRTLFAAVTKLAGDSPLYIYLNWAEKDVVESFTGLLPPYTRFRNFGYRLMQLGFTASDKK